MLSGLEQLRRDFAARSKAFDRRFDEHSRRLAEHSERLERLTRVVEAHRSAIERLSRAVEEQGRALGALQRQVMGLEARWGIMSEEAFRAGVRSLFGDQPNVRVEQWRHRDIAGKLFGYPSDVEIDVLVRDGQHILVEIKSAVSVFDVLGFARKTELYREVTGVQVNRRLIISPYVEPRARETAARFDMRSARTLRHRKFSLALARTSRIWEVFPRSRSPRSGLHRPAAFEPARRCARDRRHSGQA